MDILYRNKNYIRHILWEERERIKISVCDVTSTNNELRISFLFCLREWIRSTNGPKEWIIIIGIRIKLHIKICKCTMTLHYDCMILDMNLGLGINQNVNELTKKREEVENMPCNANDQTCWRRSDFACDMWLIDEDQMEWKWVIWKYDGN